MGGGLLWKTRQKGKGVGRVGGVGTGKGTGKSMRTRLSRLPFSKLPFSFCPMCVGQGRLGEIYLTFRYFGVNRIRLVAPYCAIPRDYLSDTPLLRAMGFLVSQHGQLGAIPPPPFLSVSPLEYMRSRGAIPSLKRGISAILRRYPMKTRQMGAIPPCAILSRKGIAR